MRNHSDKTRDIARSILPSTARRAARAEKRAGHHRARQANRRRMQRLAAAAHPDEINDELTDYRADLDDGSWDGMVFKRREADKVAPLRRWTKHHLDHDPTFASLDPLGREARLLSILGDTVAGRHAISHVRDLIGRQNPYEYNYTPHPPKQAPDRAKVLDAVLGVGAEGPLNKAIKRKTPGAVYRYTYVDGLYRRELVHELDPWLYRGDRAKFLNRPESRAEARAFEIAMDALDELAEEFL